MAELPLETSTVLSCQWVRDSSLLQSTCDYLSSIWIRPAVELVSIPSDIEQPQSRGCSAVLSSPPHNSAPYDPPWSHIALCTYIQTIGSRDPDTLPQHTACTPSIYSPRSLSSAECSACFSECRNVTLSFHGLVIRVSVRDRSNVRVRIRARIRVISIRVTVTVGSRRILFPHTHTCNAGLSCMRPNGGAMGHDSSILYAMQRCHACNLLRVGGRN